MAGSLEICKDKATLPRLRFGIERDVSLSGRGQYPHRIAAALATIAPVCNTFGFGIERVSLNEGGQNRAGSAQGGMSRWLPVGKNQ
jgi:hypothetical protein